MIKVVATNKKAFHNYHILERVEAGVVLMGTEVKSLRAGGLQIKDAYARPRRNELFLENLHISEYRHGNMQNHEPLRPRKLLLHKKEMNKWISKVAEKGLSILVLKVYFKGDFAKVELGLGKGKKLYDKREDLKRKAVERESEKQFKIRR